MERDTDDPAGVGDALHDYRTESPPPGTLTLSDKQAYVGDEVTVLGSDFPADRELELVWHTVDGQWGVIEGNEVVGPEFRPRTEQLTTVRTDASGQFDTPIVVPEDFGGGHTIEIQDPESGGLDQTELAVTPWFEVDRTTVPLGETFTIRGYGLGPNVLTNNYQLAWDDGVVGFVTSVLNSGTTTARVRAVGHVGKHVVQVWRNYRGVPFLQNNTQSPFGPVTGQRDSSWVIEVTEPEQEFPSAWMDGQLNETPLETHYPDLDEDAEAELSITPTCGQAGTKAVLTGTGFPADTEVDLVWYRHQGHRVKGVPITPEPRPDVLPSVVTDADGSFRVDVTVPTDVGSTRPITAEVDGRSVAVTGFMLQPSIESFSPTSGPVGTEIEIELSGVGWTVYENAPYFVYDNKPLGYVCGVDDEDSEGVTRVRFRAAGEPGTHFVDVYPSIFQMQDDEPNFEIKPHLSYLDNHPVRPLPAMHFRFEVTE